MRIAVGSDHAGYGRKQEIVDFLTDREFEVTDFGVFDRTRADYPDIGIAVARAVASGEFDRGILVCGSGIGMSITANKVPGIRAALCMDTYCARMSREHNDANVLTLGERVTDTETAEQIVETFLSTSFSEEERHARRIRRILEIEKDYGTGGS